MTQTEDDAVFQYDAFISIQASHLTTHQQIQIPSLLTQALTDRLLHLSPLPPHTPSSTSPGTLTWGLTLSSPTLHRTIDHGPSASQPLEAAHFRTFWGSKSELRRFKDGRIGEAVVWRAEHASQPVWEQIVRFALGQHLSAEVAAAVLCYGPEFDGLLPGYERYRGNHLGAFQAVNAAFEKLQRLLADAEALPLGLRQIRQADGSLAYSSLDTPGPRSGRSGDAVRVVLQLEASGKWPDELLALEKTRTACNLRLAQWLRTKHEAVRTAVSYEDRLATEAPTSVLDVTLDGILFRVDLHIDKHVTLLEKEIRLHPSSSAKADRAIARLRDFRRIYVQKPLHTQSIRSHCVRNPMISAAVRLFKLWVASHLLSDHIPSELAENLVLHTFIKPGKLPVPSSAMSTIFRVLHFISQWDWRHHPLLLLDSESDSDRSSAEELAAIRQRFDSGRQRDPNMRKGVIFMATGYDADGYTWTTQNPSLVSAARLTSLARAAVDILRKSAWDTKPKVLFTPRFGDYDFVLHLRKKISGQSTPENQIYHDLQAVYSPQIIFFRNGRNGSTIAGLFSPSTRSQSWTTRLRFPTLPTQTEAGAARLDRDSVMSEIARLGGDIITRIEVLKA